jgi:hypothetical protein
VLVSLLVIVSMVVALAVWLWRSISLLERRGDYSVGFGRAVAVWGWFVPFANLFIAPLVLYRVARALHAQSDLAVWGAFGVVLLPISSVVLRIGASFNLDDFEAHAIYIWWSGAAAAAWSLSGGLIAQLVGHLRNAPDQPGSV